MQGRKPRGQPEMLTPGLQFVVRTFDPAGDRAFFHASREGAAASRFAGGEQYSFAMAERTGDMYEYGKGVAKDEREAVVWYRKAAEQGDARAKERLVKLGAS
jgi:TPR repeat protein